MMTRFVCFQVGENIFSHEATIVVDDREYSVMFQSVGDSNLYDSGVIFPDGFIFSPAGCWEITFDRAENRAARTFFAPPLHHEGAKSIWCLLRALDGVIACHYHQFHAGMYCYAPINRRLNSLYRRLLSRYLGKGYTVEIGLGPERRGYVIRTPSCYRRVGHRSGRSRADD